MKSLVKNKYNLPIEEENYKKYLEILKNNIFKILCLYEEREEPNKETEWKKSLTSIILKLNGVYSLFNNKIYFLEIISKLESLYSENIEMIFFRKTIFEILNLIDSELENE